MVAAGRSLVAVERTWAERTLAAAAGTAAAGTAAAGIAVVAAGRAAVVDKVAGTAVVAGVGIAVAADIAEAVAGCTAVVVGRPGRMEEADCNLLADSAAGSTSDRRCWGCREAEGRT